MNIAGKKNILYIEGKNWSGELTFLETKIKIDLNPPMFNRIPGEIVFSKKKMTCFAKIPFLAKPFAKLVIKQITDEIRELV